MGDASLFSSPFSSQPVLPANVKQTYYIMTSRFDLTTNASVTAAEKSFSNDLEAEKELQDIFVCAVQSHNTDNATEFIEFKAPKEPLK